MSFKETISVEYPSRFSAAKMQDIAELLREVQYSIFDKAYSSIQRNDKLISLSKELFNAMNATCRKYSKCSSDNECYIKLSIIMNACIEQGRPGYKGPPPTVKTDFERETVRYG